MANDIHHGTKVKHKAPFLRKALGIGEVIGFARANDYSVSIVRVAWGPNRDVLRHYITSVEAIRPKKKTYKVPVRVTKEINVFVEASSKDEADRLASKGLESSDTLYSYVYADGIKEVE